jgi:hypothetical protein
MQGAHSILILAVVTTFCHLSISWLKKDANSCCVMSSGSAPSVAIRCFMSGLISSACIAELRVVRMASGIFAGAKAANQPMALKSFIPVASATVGTSGKRAARFKLETARTRSLPARCCSSTPMTSGQHVGTWPSTGTRQWGFCCTRMRPFAACCGPWRWRHRAEPDPACCSHA